jgi:RNA-binding protein YlmH
MNNDSKYVHFRPEERTLALRMEEWVEKASRRHEMKRTDFLDPRQAFILETIVNRFLDTHVTWFGGFEGAERKVGWITPDYIIPSQEKSEIAALSIKGDTRFVELDHGDYMGAVLGLGIKRDKVGDILVHEEGCHLITVKEISDYIRTHLRQVHRLQVTVEDLSPNQLILTEKRLEEMSFTVASLRLDGVASDAYRLSRSKILGPIQSGKVKVNWKPVTDPSTPLSKGDIVSIKGLGRFEITEVEGPTKKGRIRVKIGKFS